MVSGAFAHSYDTFVKIAPNSPDTLASFQVRSSSDSLLKQDAGKFPARSFCTIAGSGYAKYLYSPAPKRNFAI